MPGVDGDQNDLASVRSVIDYIGATMLDATDRAKASSALSDATEVRTTVG